MQINFLTNNFVTRKNTPNNSPKSNPINSARLNAGANLAPLSADTVSFSGGGYKLVDNTIADILEAKMESLTPRFRRIATTYLDILESVALKLKDDGFSFDRAYCEQNPIKSPKSYISKVRRSNSFKVPDQIRATIYLDNPYDYTKLNKLLEEMEKRGYILEDTKVTIKDLMKRGYIPTDKEAKNLEGVKVVPDIDIRLEDAADGIADLPPHLRLAVGKPQKSGYEDIQMRFVRDFDLKRDKVSHELIVLFGPNYSLAKHAESTDVYGNLRKFGQLHFNPKEAKDNDHAKRLDRYIELVNEMFTGKISKKLFLNAKNKDFSQMEEVIPIKFSKSDIDLFKGYFSAINEKLIKCYNMAKSTASSSADKRAISKDMREDLRLITDIQNALFETIKKYNSHSTPKQA